jgi:hypothetical protein
MLIQTPYKSGDTVTIKLTSGEEIVARLEKEESGNLELHKPRMIAATQQGLGLAPFTFTADEDAKITINDSKVVCIVKTAEEFAKQYTSSTTGIAM